MENFAFVGMEEEYYGSVDVAYGSLSGKAVIQRLMDVESALAQVQAELGLIPADCAEEIHRKCNAKLLDEALYREKRLETGHPLMCMLHAYKAICDGAAGEYLHWGATTQDIEDTARMLQLKETYDIIMGKSRKLHDILKRKVLEHKSTIMIGRTNGQHAVPITLGFKMASWLDEWDRCIERLEQGENRIFVGQFAGAVGTMASLGEAGLEIQKRLMARLGLGCPNISWFSARDRLVEFASDLSLLCGCLGRMGNEIFNEERTEVAELSESFHEGQVGSSTMPHKRNPVLPIKLIRAGRESRAFMVSAYTSMEASNERDNRVLSAEPFYMKGLCSAADSALDAAIPLLAGLEADGKRMMKNADLLHGLIYSEAVMMRLAKKAGRMQAHEWIHQYAMQAVAEQRNLKEILLSDSRIMEMCTEEELEDLMRSENYIGLSVYFAEKAAAQ